jgi:hypothetical protein
METGFFGYIVLAAILLFVGSKIYAGFKEGLTGDDGIRHCMTCGTESKPVTRVKGSLLIEIVLWLCFLVPGLIYSIWRLTSKQQICSSCNSTTLVPTNSPAATNQRKILQEGNRQ